MELALVALQFVALVVEMTVPAKVQRLGDLDGPSEFLTCVIGPPHLALEVLVELALHLINATFYCALFSWICG